MSHLDHLTSTASGDRVPSSTHRMSSNGRSMLTIRRRIAALMLYVVFAAAWPAPLRAYGVLTHHQLIDQAWNTVIVPALLKRFPALTPDELRSAHAYAYGGCV